MCSRYVPPMTFHPTESDILPWKQKIYSPPTKRLTFTLGDARIELMQYVVCMHKGLEVKMGNVFSDAPLSNETFKWRYTLKGTYSTWQDFFRHAYKLAVKHHIINKEHLMNITHDNAQDDSQKPKLGFDSAVNLYINSLKRLLPEKAASKTPYEKDMEQNEGEMQNLAHQIAEEIRAIKTKSFDLPTIPIVSLPALPDRKSMHKVYKQKYLEYTIVIYASDATHHATTDYYAYLKHTSGRRRMLAKTTESFSTKEEAYYAAILWITHLHGFDVPSISDIINVEQEKK